MPYGPMDKVILWCFHLFLIFALTKQYTILIGVMAVYFPYHCLNIINPYVLYVIKNEKEKNKAECLCTKSTM